MEIKFGNIMIEVPYEKYLMKSMMRKNPFDSMFSKTNPGFSGNLLNKPPVSMTDYFEGFAKMMRKFTKMRKPGGKHDEG